MLRDSDFAFTFGGDKTLNDKDLMQYFQAFNFLQRIFDFGLRFVGTLHVEVRAIRVMKFEFWFVCQYW